MQQKFDHENLIKCGGFGFVSKAILKFGIQMVVKKLIKNNFDGEKEFLSYMQTHYKATHENSTHLW